MSFHVRYASANVAVFLACAAGCSNPPPSVATVPVSGSVVLHDGKPVAEATVVFHPETPLPPGIHNPVAVTGPDGGFQLTTLNPGDGAPSGGYRVTVELRGKRLVGEEQTRDGPHILPEKFARPTTTPLRAVVATEPTRLPPFVLR